MSELSRVLNIFPVPVTWTNPLRHSYDRDVPSHPNEEFDNPHLCDAPFVTPLPFSVFQYLKWYPTCFNADRFWQVQADVNEWRGWDRLSQRRDISVSGWAKPWSHWDGRRTLSCRCVVDETDSPFLQCR